MSPFARLEGLISPAPDPARVAFLKLWPFAHRGLHGRDVIENSLPAFAAAISGGYGMECDVQTSLDGIPYVFHDEMLDRLTAERGLLGVRLAALLDSVVLNDGEPLPRLDALLQRIGGAAPLLIEIKALGRKVGFSCRGVRRALEGYRGPVAVMSFNPQVGAWFKAHAPRIVRGLVVTEEGKPRWRGASERALALWRSNPDFLAYDIRSLPSRFAARARSRGLPVLTWTVRDADQERIAFDHADQIVFEKPDGP